MKTLIDFVLFRRENINAEKPGLFFFHPFFSFQNPQEHQEMQNCELYDIVHL